MATGRYEGNVTKVWPTDAELFPEGVRKGVVRFSARVRVSGHATGPMERLAKMAIRVERKGVHSVLLEKTLRVADDQRNYAVPFDLPAEFTVQRIDLQITGDTGSAELFLADREVVTAAATAAFDDHGAYGVVQTDFQPHWKQDGRVLSVSWLGNTFSAFMPTEFELDTVPVERVALASELLFGEIERVIFGRSRRLLEVTRASSPKEFELGEPSRVLLCFSAGEDSTAALELLPPQRTVAFYSERFYSSYLTAAGAKISLDSSFEKKALRHVPDLVRVPNDFETIGITVGMAFGYRDSFGYAAIGSLLTRHLKCNVIAFGSVMEQIFMKSGYNYSDVVNYKGSRLVAYRSLFRSVGLYFSVPTGALSEILTHQVTKNNHHGYIAVPCPSTTPAGEACGSCFKCFRKMRFDHGANAPDPSPSATKFITSRPMKSATSVVTAAQVAGETRFGLAEYADVDVSFVHRYHREGLVGLVPEDLVADLESALAERGIEPMTLEDEYRLRTVAHIFDPGNFSVKRSFPGRTSERFADMLGVESVESL